MAEIKKALKDELAPFFESPDRVKFRDIVRGRLGEHSHIDFKNSWIEDEKLTSQILGMANNGGGGIVFGVRQNDDNSFEPIGLESLRDPKNFYDYFKSYLPEKLSYGILDFDYQESDWGSLKGKKFQIIIIEDTPQYIPFLAMRDGPRVKKNRIYYRNGSEAAEATYEQVQEIINRRIDTGYSTTAEDVFRNDLNQLKILYEQIPRYLDSSPILTSIAYSLANILQNIRTQNPEYPQETFEDFINRMIERKKMIIENAVINREI